MSAKKQRHAARRKDHIQKPAPSKRAPARRFWSPATLSDTPLAALAITLLVYLRCLENGLVYDDHEMIILNRYIGDWAMVWRSFVNDSWWFRNPLSLPQSAYYRPLQDVWLAVNYHLFGLAPVGWHLAIVAVHLVAVYLVFDIARELGGSRWTPSIAATVFGVLPIHAQAVVWPTAIPLPMSAIFELAAFLFFIRSGRGAASRFLAPILFAMALLSHESAVVFPLIIVAYGVLIAPDAPTSWRERLVRVGVAAAPFFIEVALYLVIRREVLGFITRLNITNPMTPAQGWLTVPNAIGTYAMMLIMPWRAGPVHPVDVVSSIRASQFYLPLLAVIGLAVSGAVALWNDSRRLTYLFWAIWIAVSIGPVLDLRAFSPLALVEDRYLYMASVAWCIALTDIAVALFMSIDASGRMLAAAAATVILAFGASLFHVESYWHDEIALFGTCVEMAPRSTLCHDRLGLALKSRGDKEDAEREFLIAQELEPDDAANLYNLGLVHAEMGRQEEALGELKRALAGLPDAPPVAYVDLAKLADSIGKTDERDEALRHAEKLPEGVLAVELGRAQMAIEHRDFAAAESLARDAIARAPRIPDGWTLLGIALMNQKRVDEALDAYDHSLELKPDATLQKTLLRLRARRSANQNLQ
ncbi:MAG TPA: tetratricopeptide repeat protein [Candidatus Binataceae bacterium]|nr:tetratricopeptide repeat protein [Candidatus Binataceae bacterium]